MPEPAREALAREAFDAAMNIQGDWLRGRALSMLRCIPTAELRRRALEAALALKAPQERASALSAFAGDLPPDELEWLLAQAASIPDEWLRQSLLASLAELGHALPDWEPALREDALAEARSLAQPSERAETLSGSLASMPEELRAQPAGEALAAARAVSDPAVRAALLADLIEFLPEGRVSEVVGEAGLAAREIVDPILRAERLSGLIPFLKEAERPAGIGEVLTPFER